ncbi:lipocalin family protein [Salinimicrobium soli]|uniref:lipocalin family protein n=1 Tax=Salinimicrobium soli TaxID=1254399 RepID=UPI003AB04DAC
MKKHFLTLFLTLFLFSCTSTEEKIHNLNGYWEIQKAELPEGITKEFKFSEIVDYIQVEENEGFRKKVRPQLGGGFLTSDDRENFEVKVENDSINLYYRTPYNEWKESVLSSEENELVILNQQGIIYTYKRFTPYSSDYGQEN